MIKTIKYMQPGMFAMENADEIGKGDADDDLSPITTFMDEQVGDCYHTLIITGISPLQHGYALEKKRVLLIGGRQDQVCKDALANIFNKLIEHPAPVTHTYRTSPGCQPLADDVLDAVGHLPSPAAAVMIQSSICKYGTDPMIECPEHPCCCDKCKAGER